MWVDIDVLAVAVELTIVNSPEPRANFFTPRAIVLMTFTNIYGYA